MTVTYYLEVLSSWCNWAEPTWAELKTRFEPRGVKFEWKIALMNPADFPVSRAQCDWFYRRSGGTVMHSDVMLNSGWFESARRGDYAAPNLVAEAARSLGITGDAVRLALARAALHEGKKIGDLSIAVNVAAKAAKLSVPKLRHAAESAAIREKVDATTAEFLSHQISQRPAFIFTNAIGDKAVFSGVARSAPLVATIEAMLSDAAAYRAHAAHHGPAPAV